MLKATPKPMSDKAVPLVDDNPGDAELMPMALTRFTGVDDTIFTKDCAHGSVCALRFPTESHPSSGYPVMLPTVIFPGPDFAPTGHAANSR
jgi:hypothetical protein